MNRILVVLLALLSLGLGSVALVLHHRVCVAENALAELRNSQVSQPKGDSPQKGKGDSPQKGKEVQGDSPQGVRGDSPQGVKEQSRKKAVTEKDRDNSVTNLPFEVTAIKYDEGKIRVSFLNAGKRPVVAPEQNALSISPALKTSFAVAGDKIIVRGDFKPNTLYTAILSPDWRSADGRRLGREARLSIRTPQLEPVFNLLSRGTYYPVKSIGTLRFPYEARFVTNLTVRISKAFENNLNYYNLGSWQAEQRMIRVAEAEIHLSPPYHETANRMLELDNILTNRAPGFYRLQIETDGYRRNWWGGSGSPLTEETTFALTDLGVNAAISEKDGRQAFAAVCRFSDGQPVAGADVTFLSQKNRIVTQGKTGADGSLRSAHEPRYASQDDRVRGVLVKTADDLS